MERNRMDTNENKTTLKYVAGPWLSFSLIWTLEMLDLGNDGQYKLIMQSYNANTGNVQWTFVTNQ